MIRTGITLLLLAALLLNTGCWDRREINDLAFVMAMGLEITENDWIKITVQVAKAGELIPGSPGSAKPYWVISGEGRNVFEAVRNLSLRTPRRLYYAHNQILIFDEGIAQKGLGPHLDLLLRNFELRKNAWVFVAQGLTPEEMLTVEVETEAIPGAGIESIIRRQGANDKTAVRTLREYIKDSGGEPWAAVAGAIRPVKTHDFPQGDEISPPPVGKPQTMQEPFIEGAAVFVQTKLVGYLDGPEVQGMRFITGDAQNSLITALCTTNPRTYDTVELLKGSSKLDITLQEGKPKGKVVLDLNVSLGELGSQTDPAIPENIKALEAKAGRQVISQMEAAVAALQAMEADVLGFGAALAKKDKAYWRENRGQWNQIFAQMPVEFEVTVTIQMTELRTRNVLR